MPESPDVEPSPVTFYWRPGCPFCMSLERSLRKSGVPIEKRNIWEDPEAAAFVRSVANGNETVPTVTVGGRFMVNPTGKQVVATVAEELPEFASSQQPDVEDGALGNLMRRILGS